MSHPRFRALRSAPPRLGALVLASVVAVAVVTVLTPGRAAAAEPQTEDRRSTYKVVPYVISDPDLGARPGRLIRELRRSGDLDRFGIKPATGDRPSVVSAANQAADEPVSYVTDSGRFGGGNPDDIYDYPTAQDCQDSGSAEDDAGWIKNRYSYCQIHTVLMSAFDCSVIPPRCRLAGVLDSRNTIIGHGKVGGYVFGGEPEWRYADFRLDMDVERTTGVFNRPGATLTAALQCDGTYESPADGVDEDNACVSVGGPTTRPVKRWRQRDTAEFTLASEALRPSREHGEQIATGEFHLEYDVDLPDGYGSPSSESPEGGMRFDSAWYLNAKKRGSVFDRAVPGFAYSLSDTKVAGVAAHIFDARSRPDNTIPVQEGKVLNGASAGDPIHRLAPSKSASTRKRYDRNEAVVRKGFCRSRGMPPKPEDGGPFDCDEYSFASTYEGGARHEFDGDQYRRHYSVRWVDRKVNQEAGRRLGRWYGVDRILDHEDFFVPITQ